MSPKQERVFEVVMFMVMCAGIVAIMVLICNCGTQLSSLDARALLHEQRAAVELQRRVEDDGPEAALAEAIYCSAGAVLRRAGSLSEDAGISCPKQ